MTTSSTAPLAIWGGVECTVNRVQDSVFDQIQRSGHCARGADIDLLASLGIRALRYPVLWERVAPRTLEDASWTWSDDRLTRIRACGIEPIVGLVHHGSGPRYTSLVDPGFPDALARYAAAVAARYPWVTSYTPINEPLTTARFSTLYGHWYPHARDDRQFARAVVNQCRATVLAMQAIRRIQPDARLVQTEDLGRTHSTPPLAHQARMENERRWLTFDLLTGQLATDDPMWGYLVGLGIAPDELQTFRDDPCSPAILGINHYVTSERFLDHRVDQYPPDRCGGNGHDQYADVEAVRVLRDGVAGPVGLLAEAWDRYRQPLAITEVHVGATREQQLRWLRDSWTAANGAREAGIDVRAITAWALLGSFDWDSLVTLDEGHYESGAWDVRGPQPRQTAVGTMVRALAATGCFDHPVLHGDGWWKHDSRILFPAGDPPAALGRASPVDDGRRPLLIVGATGTLGRAFARICAERDIAARLSGRDEMELSDAPLLAATLDRYQPWAVVNAAGYVRVDDAESDADACHRDNCRGAELLALACAHRGIPLLSFSSDLVFDGASPRPYVESDRTRPLGIYGLSKADAERAMLAAAPTALVVRTSAFFGPWDEHNFVAAVLRALDSATPFVAPDDEIVSPTYVPDLVHCALDLLIDGESGIWHLANVGAMSWSEFGRRAADLAGFDTDLVIGTPGRTLQRRAARPPYSVLGSERGLLLPPLEDALYRFIAARAALSPATYGAE